MLKISDILNMYLEDENLPRVIDLSGGQPDLVPEWILWMMEELKSRGKDILTYLWSDNNLTNDFFWKFLVKKEIDLIKSYNNYGKVCCFKGFDEKSFSFNTNADSILFNRQFELMKKNIHLGIGELSTAAHLAQQR